MAVQGMSYSELRACAADFGKAAAEMDRLFNNLKVEMNSLGDVLKSKGADRLYDAYKELERKLPGYPDKVREFEAFINTAVDQYEANDAALQSEI